MPVLHDLSRDKDRYLQVEGHHRVLKWRAVLLSHEPLDEACRVFLLSRLVKGRTGQSGNLSGIHDQLLVAKVLNQLDGHI